MRLRPCICFCWFACVVLVGLASPSWSAGQETSSNQSYRVPRTPDGQPDLQGFWSNQTFTPLERPEGVTSAFYTEEELAAREGRVAVRESAQTEPGTISWRTTWRLPARLPNIGDLVC